MPAQRLKWYTRQGTHRDGRLTHRRAPESISAPELCVVSVCLVIGMGINLYGSSGGGYHQQSIS